MSGHRNWNPHRDDPREYFSWLSASENRERDRRELRRRKEAERVYDRVS
jgi:hypothetical protein